MNKTSVIKAFRFEDKKGKATPKPVDIFVWTDQEGLLHIDQQPIGHITLEDGVDLCLAILNRTSGAYCMVQTRMPV